MRFTKCLLAINNNVVPRSYSMKILISSKIVKIRSDKNTWVSYVFTLNLIKNDEQDKFLPGVYIELYKYFVFMVLLILFKA